MKLKDYSKFAMCEYNQQDEPNKFSLGDVVTKESDDDIEVGVVIQIHDRGDLRVDMFGNEWDGNLRLSTMEEIKKYRPVFLKHLA